MSEKNEYNEKFEELEKKILKTIKKELKASESAKSPVITTNKFEVRV